MFSSFAEHLRLNDVLTYEQLVKICQRSRKPSPVFISLDRVRIFPSFQVFKVIILFFCAHMLHAVQMCPSEGWAHLNGMHACHCKALNITLWDRFVRSSVGRLLEAVVRSLSAVDFCWAHQTPLFQISEESRRRQGWHVVPRRHADFQEGVSRRLGA